MMWLKCEKQVCLFPICQLRESLSLLGRTRELVRQISDISQISNTQLKIFDQFVFTKQVTPQVVVKYRYNDQSCRGRYLFQKQQNGGKNFSSTITWWANNHSALQQFRTSENFYFISFLKHPIVDEEIKIYKVNFILNKQITDL